jgi:ABC-type multidrug transport system ATPase subunit
MFCEIGTNHTVIFSTHIVDDVKELCEIAILNGEKILTQNTPTAVIETLNGSIGLKL